MAEDIAENPTLKETSDVVYIPERVTSFNIPLEGGVRQFSRTELVNSPDNPHGHFSVLVEGIPIAGELKDQFPDFEFEKGPDFTIDYLSLRPEESLPVDQLAKETKYRRTILGDDLSVIAEGKSKAAIGFHLGLELFSPIHGDGESGVSSKDVLNDAIQRDPSKRVLVISGHGGFKEWAIGESHDANLAVRYVLDSLPNILKKNGTLGEKEHFDDHYSAVIVAACNGEKDILDQRLSNKLKTPIFYPSGYAGAGSVSVEGREVHTEPVMIIPSV